jgi:Fic family protein
VGIVQGSRVAHVAPPAKRVPALVESLLGWAKSDRETHPLVKSAVVHYELEFIHPFSDGNGRIGRLWQHVVLVRYSRAFEYVPVESVIHARQAEYYRVLGVCDRAGNATPFVEFSLDALREAMRSLLADLRPEKATTDTRLAAAHRAFGSKEFSRKEYMGELKTLSTATASRDLREGVERRVLAKRGTKSLTRYRFR